MNSRIFHVASLALLTTAAHAQVTFLQDGRRMSGMIDSCAGMSDQSDAADAVTEAFDASYSDRFEDGGSFVEGEVSVSSDAPGPGGFAGAGRAALTREWPGCARAASLESNFGFTFHVPAPVRYRITGSVASSQSTFYTWSTVQLVKKLGDIGILFEREYLGVPEGLDFDDTGVLLEGTYFLSADAVILDDSEGYTGDAEYTVAISFDEVCRPDCTQDGVLNVNDFICFQSEWRAKSAYGDYNGDGLWNINDFIAFQFDFRGGC